MTYKRKGGIRFISIGALRIQFSVSRAARKPVYHIATLAAAPWVGTLLLIGV